METAHHRGKADRVRLDKLIRAESWLTAQEAVDLGMADEILGWEDAPEGAAEFVDAIGGNIRTLVNSVGPGASPPELLARYERLVRNGAAPAEGHPVDAPDGTEHSDPSGRLPETIADDWTRRARGLPRRNPPR